MTLASILQQNEVGFAWPKGHGLQNDTLLSSRHGLKNPSLKGGTLCARRLLVADLIKFEISLRPTAVKGGGVDQGEIRIFPSSLDTSFLF